MNMLECVEYGNADGEPKSQSSAALACLLVCLCSCDGTYTENCDSSRDYTNIADLLTDQGASDTLSFMKEYWVDINGQNERFWEVGSHPD